MYNTLTPKNMKGSPMASNSLELLDSAYVDPKLLITSARPSQKALHDLFRPKNLLERAKYNTGLVQICVFRIMCLPSQF